jgi:hypothetical protein
VSTSDTPPPGYASDPQLEMLWTTPPSLTGLAASGTTSGTPPLSSPFAVSLASIRSGEQDMLGAASTVVTAYNALETKVQGIVGGGNSLNGGGFFGQWAERPGYREVSVPTTLPDDPLSQAAVQFAAQINPAMTRALRAVADSMATVGVFIAMLNTAGQAYTTADKNSAVPAPTTD